MAVCRAAALIFVVCSLAITLPAQSPGPSTSSTSSPQIDDQTARDRRYAIELYHQGKCLEALPWVEKLVLKLPDDAVLHEALGGCLVAKAATLSDPAARRATRVQARQEFLKAKSLGDNSDYVSVELGLPEDGRDPEYSGNAEVDRLIKQGEAAFGAGKLDDAKKSYLEALVIDPKNYGALLFIGDIYFRKGDAVAAGEWFSRAIQVDPGQETAYRYWGDALLSSGKMAAAREKYIDGVLCNPYERRSWAGLDRYLYTTKQKATWYKFQSPNSFSASDKGGGTINLDAASLDKKDGSAAWIGYPMERLLWKSEKFAKEYPNEKQYRHSLKEESSALSLVAATAQQLASGKKAEQLSPDLQALVKLKNAGLLDAYILLTAPDAGIAQDYLAYRQVHRDVLVRYLSEVVLPPAPADTAH